MPTLGAHDARARLEERIESRLIMVWTTGAEGGDSGVNQLGIELRQGFVVDAIAFRRPGPQIFYDDIGFTHQVIYYISSFWGVEIYCQPALALIPTEEAK